MVAFSTVLPVVALAAVAVAAPFEGSTNGTFALDKKAADFSGRFTWYDITTGTTACGGNYGSSAFVVALNQAQWDGRSHCNKKIKVSARGKTTTATIVDLCPGCPFGGLDLTKGLFDFFAGPGAAGSSTDPGVLQGTWEFA